MPYIVEPRTTYSGGGSLVRLFFLASRLSSFSHYRTCFIVIPRQNHRFVSVSANQATAYSTLLSAVTQCYIGIEPQRIEKAVEGHTELL